STLTAQRWLFVVACPKRKNGVHFCWARWLFVVACPKRKSGVHFCWATLVVGGRVPEAQKWCPLLLGNAGCWWSCARSAKVVSTFAGHAPRTGSRSLRW